MTHHELPLFFLSLAIVLAVARLFGEIARRYGQPAVLGEILAGIVLGPTVFGTIAPGIQAQLFPQSGALPVAFQAITTLAIALFLLVAGLDVDLSSVFRQGRSSLVISCFGIVIPFVLGFACAWGMPRAFGAEPDSGRLLFALFVGTALSVSALPVIAKTLLDLDMYRSDLGMTVISVAVIDDLVGWLLFAIILGMMGKATDAVFSVPATITLTLLFAVLMLTLGRWIIHRALPPVQAYTSWPGGVLSFAVVGGLLCAAFTEWIGVHAIFGAFFFGVALGDSRHLREKTRHTLENFVSFIFAPLFFGTIGLRVNFAAHFDPTLVLAVILVACAGKIVGCSLAARLARFPWREALAVSMGMNARGGMGIILALLALEAGLIRERMFVALVVMSLFTSIIAGDLMQRLLRREKATRFLDFLSPGSFMRRLESIDRRAAIDELTAVACRGISFDPAAVAEAVWQREQMVPTGIGQDVAIPHARLAGLANAVVAVGLSKRGIDFDSPDGEPSRLIFLILTPQDDNKTQLEILKDISRTLHDTTAREAALRADSYVEFVAALKSAAR